MNRAKRLVTPDGIVGNEQDFWQREESLGALRRGCRRVIALGVPPPGHDLIVLSHPFAPTPEEKRHPLRQVRPPSRSVKEKKQPRLRYPQR